MLDSQAAGCRGVTAAAALAVTGWMRPAGVWLVTPCWLSQLVMAVTEGTLRTDNGVFIGLLLLVVLLVGALSFFPALALGPVAEFLQAA